VEEMHGYQFGMHGYPLDRPRQPVVRVSWNEARAFCAWLGSRAALRCRLPTEAEWEHACRAGTSTPFSHGGLDDDFSRHANLGDARLREYAIETYIQVRLIPNPNRFDDWVPKDGRFDDGSFVSADAGSYAANPWGLHDLHGNVWEWTLSAYRPYPYRDDDGRNDAPEVAPGSMPGSLPGSMPDSMHASAHGSAHGVTPDVTPEVTASGTASGKVPDERRVARGGSWYDRPKRCRSAFRLAYAPYQRGFNVGFRVLVEDAGQPDDEVVGVRSP
jgi:formylglycine-generating enzyme required for sulfatase activity